MKRELLYGLSMILVLLLPSCLGEGGSEVTLANQPAVVRGTTDGNVLVINGGSIISSAEFRGRLDVSPGDCALVDFMLDFSAAENINKESAGVYTAEKINYNPIRSLPLEPTLTDTLELMEQERIVSSVYNKSCLLEERLFLFTEHSIQLSDLVLDLSYDADAGPSVDNNKRIYDLYFRMVGDSINASKSIIYNAFNLSEFIQKKGGKERDAGKDSLFFRVKYLSAIRSDSTGVWKATPEFHVVLP